MDTTDSNRTGKHWGMWCLHQDQEACALGSPQHRLADLCPHRRIAARLHHAIPDVPLPVLPRGNLTVAIRTPTVGKPRNRQQTKIHLGWGKQDSEAKAHTIIMYLTAKGWRRSTLKIGHDRCRSQATWWELARWCPLSSRCTQLILARSFLGHAFLWA